MQLQLNIGECMKSATNEQYLFQPIVITHTRKSIANNIHRRQEDCEQTLRSSSRVITQANLKA